MGARLGLVQFPAGQAIFVGDGDAIDTEAWTRGETLYLPDGKSGLYPKVLSEGAASLLPDGPRPESTIRNMIRRRRAACAGISGW